MPAVRIFVAILLSPEVKAALGQCQELLGAGRRPYVKWVNHEGMHLTLKFLGNVGEERLSRIEKALAEAATGEAPFRLRLAQVGAFPSPCHPRVLWIGMEGDLERLGALHQAVEKALTRMGFPKEGRAFSPHLTLGRVRETATPAQRQELAEVLERPPAVKGLEIAADAIHLMRSELLREGAHYTSLYQVELGDLPA